MHPMQLTVLPLLLATSSQRPIIGCIAIPCLTGGSGLKPRPGPRGAHRIGMSEYNAAWAERQWRVIHATWKNGQIVPDSQVRSLPEGCRLAVEPEFAESGVIRDFRRGVAQVT